MPREGFFINRLVKNAHLRRYPVPLGGVAKSRSLFVATAPLILPRIKRGAGLCGGHLVGNAYMRSLRRNSGALHLGIFDQPVKE